MSKKAYFIGVLVLGFLVVQSAQAKTQTIYKNKYNKVRLIPIDKKITAGEPVEHPYTIDKEKIYNMLASLRFGRHLIIFKDSENRSLFDKRGLELLSPYLAQAFKEASPEQMVQFTYIKKAPHWRVIRNDRLITGKAFIRAGELYIKFSKLYAKVLGDYERAGQGEYFFNRARDIGSSLEAKPGQRTLSTKFIALKIDHNYREDLQRYAEQEAAAKKAAEESKKVKGVPLPEAAGEESATGSSSDASLTASNGDTAGRLETLKELRKKKLISEREYQKKRKEIIGGI